MKATEEMDIIFKTFIDIANDKKIGHTEKSKKELLKKELLNTEEKQLDSMYSALEIWESIDSIFYEYSKEPTDEFKKAVIELLNNSEAIFNHFEIDRPLKIEELLKVKLEDSKIKENINTLLQSEKVISNANDYHQDGRKQTKGWQNRTIDKYSGLETAGLEIFLTAANQAFYDAVLEKYGKNYKRSLTSIIKQQVNKEAYKDEIKDIENCLLKKHSTVKPFILFDSVLEKLKIHNIRTSRNKKRATIPLFTSIEKAIYTNIQN